MIGYVQTDTLERWHGELQERVHKEAIELNLEDTETSVKFASTFPLEWASTHRRDAHDPVRLFHIILDCRKAGHKEQN